MSLFSRSLTSIPFSNSRLIHFTLFIDSRLWMCFLSTTFQYSALVSIITSHSLTVLSFKIGPLVLPET